MSSLKWKGKRPVDAGNVSVLDADEFGAPADMSVPPGKYEVAFKAETWLGNKPQTGVIITKSGRLHIGDFCYLHHPRNDEMCDASMGGKRVEGFLSFNTGGDGMFDVELELNQL